MLQRMVDETAGGGTPCLLTLEHARAALAKAKDANIVHDTGKYWVYRDRKNHAYTVYIATLTHSIPESSYRLDNDGLSVAIARADYLARAKG